MNIVALFNALPGGCAQGLIWGIMAIGVFITYKILDLAESDRRRHDVYRGCGLCRDDDEWAFRWIFPVLRICCRYAGWSGERAFSIRRWESRQSWQAF